MFNFEYFNYFTLIWFCRKRYLARQRNFQKYTGKQLSEAFLSLLLPRSHEGRNSFGFEATDATKENSQRVQGQKESKYLTHFEDFYYTTELSENEKDSVSKTMKSFDDNIPEWNKKGNGFEQLKYEPRKYDLATDRLKLKTSR